MTARAKKSTPSKEGERAPRPGKRQQARAEPRQQEYVLGPFGGLMTREEFEACQAQQQKETSS